MKSSHIMMTGAGATCLAALAFWIGTHGAPQVSPEESAGYAGKVIVPGLVPPELTETAQIGQ